MQPAILQLPSLNVRLVSRRVGDSVGTLVVSGFERGGARGVIEILKVVLENVTKLIPVGDLLKQRRSDSVAAVGLELFELYNNVISVAQNGSRVLDVMDYAVARHRYYFQTGSDAGVERAEQRLASVMEEQSLRLTNLLSRYVKMRTAISISTSSSSTSKQKRLEDLLKEKRNLLALMSGSGSALLNPGILFHSELNLYKLSNAAEEDIIDQEAEDLVRSIQETYTQQLPWSPEVNALLEEYLTSGFGEKRLNQLVDAAGEFRTAFQTAFKLEDVLLANERRLRRQAR
jgi:hypothetical protein